MEIEIGEYVRTNDGLIGKLIRIERDNIDTSLKWYVFYDNKNERYINKPYITKHSQNIIDLIEVGDFVNGRRCIDIEENYTDDGRRNLNFVCISGSILELSNKIYSILTKEQYNQNCYRLDK